MLTNNSTVLITIISVATVLFAGYAFFSVRGLWKLFDFAGFPGWLCLVPILNMAIMFRIAKMSSKWLLACIPIVTIPLIFLIWLFRICKAFEKDSNYVLLSLFFWFITIPLIGFGEKKYDFDKK